MISFFGKSSGINQQIKFLRWMEVPIEDFFGVDFADLEEILPKLFKISTKKQEHSWTKKSLQFGLNASAEAYVRFSKRLFIS